MLSKENKAGGGGVEGGRREEGGPRMKTKRSVRTGAGKLWLIVQIHLAAFL